MTTQTKALKMALKTIESEGWCDTEPVIAAIKEALAQPEQEPVPNLYVKDINGNFHLYKEKGHTENCAAFGDDCCPENHLPPSRVGVGEVNFTSQPKEPEQEPWSNVGIGVDVTKEGVSVVGIYKLSNDSSHLFYSQFYTTPPQRKPLTEYEIDCIRFGITAAHHTEHAIKLTRAIEAAHGIKE